jgi:acyl-CoA synthetase (AMP-forming)/AMP-acid ligase II
VADAVSLAALLARQGDECTGQPMLLAARGGRTLSAADLAASAGGWSTRFDGAANSRPIALAIGDPLDFAAAFLGLLAAGVTVAPLDPNAPLPRLADDLAEIGGAEGIALLVTDRDVPAGFAPRIARPRTAPALESSAAPRFSRSGRVLLRSSGTTGGRKQILLTEGQLLHTAAAVARHHRLLPHDRGFSPLPLFHINAEVVGLLATVVSGASLVIDDRFHRGDFWQTVEAHRVTWINAVPGILALLATEAPVPPPRCVRFVRSASAPLPTAVLERFERATGLGVLETYGMTEASSQITANPLHGPRRPGSVGLPVASEVRVMAAAGTACAPGESGSIEIRGAGVVPGRLPGGWLVTGDVGHLDADGYLFLTGRSGDIINRGGEKVFPRPVEEELLRDEDVVDVAVVGRPDPVLGSVPVAFVVPRAPELAATLAARLRRRCEEQLARARRPAAVHIVWALPTGATGKVSRRLVCDEQEALVAQELASA